MNNGVMFVPVLFDFHQYLTVCLSVISQWTRHATFLRTIPNDEKRKKNKSRFQHLFLFHKEKKIKKNSFIQKKHLFLTQIGS